VITISKITKQEEIDQNLIIIQDSMKSSGSSVYILIPKTVRDKLNIKDDSTYKLVCNIKQKEVTIKFK